ncbi:MAG: AAA family ATPase [Clostridia bacterium]|nr:AAA family ATPase [Clostridia bacterium]
MNNFDDFKQITKLIPLHGEGIDWSALEATSLSSIFKEMAKTNQNPLYHQEIDVLTHTKMVCEKMVEQPEYINGSERDKTVLFWAALLHDIGKTACTVENDGVLTSPHHSSKGSVMARALLWRDLGLCGNENKQQLREAICLLIRYHSFPPYALSNSNPELKLLTVAANGELAKNFSLGKLCVLERADALGRISSSAQDMFERIECCRMLAEELECLNMPYEFSDDFSKRAYFKGKTSWREDSLFNDSWGKVILMSGLPGTGKDTYIKANFSHLPMISLDEIRKELGIPPTAKQGKVVAIAHERAREYLRKKQPFVWNATNITAQTRDMQISLFEGYGASVETVFLETEWDEQLNRNRNRETQVPSSVIENMLSKLVLPERYESEKIIWKIV